MMLSGILSAFGPVTLSLADSDPCDSSWVIVETGSEEHSFLVRVADDAASRAQGLMFVESMPEDEGMLFIYPSPQHARFWMKNTYIPLDMIFVDADGLVLRLHEGAEPLDETIIDGGSGVSAVLEVNAGVVDSIGVEMGDRLLHPSLQSFSSSRCE